MDFQDYVKEFLDELRTDAAINATDAGDEFILKTFELMESVNELKDPVQFYFGKSGRRNRPMQIDGYCFDDAENSLILLLSDFEDSHTPENLTNSKIDSLYKKMINFLDEVCNGDLQTYCDDSDDALKLSRLIKTRISDQISPILKIKFYIISNRRLSERVKKLKEDEFNEKPVEVHLWPIERLFEVSNSFNNEPITIDIINDFHSKGIPCIRGDIGNNLGYSAFIAIIPGKLLADIYIEHGSRVLEGNVRAFLGSSGSKSVNFGIKRTIMNEPTNFFTYNNGIAVTASKIELSDFDGELRITKIEDMQIINGGQTTASLAAAVLKKENVSLDGIFIPMKITVIEDRDSVDEDGIKFYDKMVQFISRYANSQNKVTAADFFSNSPYHVLLERMSKKYFAPPVNGSPVPTGWYYERARKKYDQEQIKMSKSERDKFAQKYPKKQIIKKEELAKYLYSIDCNPHIVSRGSNWIMKDFGASIDNMYAKNKAVFNEFYFKKCVAAAIIFRTVDRMVLTAPWYQKGGYKLNIVPYTISKIIDSIPDGYSIDWMRIWQCQSLYPSFVREIEVASKITNDFIIQSHGIIVTEYCKRKETWDTFREKPYTLSDGFIKDLIDAEDVREQAADAGKEQKALNNISVEIEVARLGSSYWQALLDAANKKHALTYKDISLLNVAANMEKTGKYPSPLQARAIKAIKQKLDDEGIIV